MKIKDFPGWVTYSARRTPVYDSWMPRPGFIGEGHLVPCGGECLSWLFTVMGPLQMAPCWELGFPDTLGWTISQLWGEKILCDPFLLLDVGQGEPALAPSLCCSLSLRASRPIRLLLTTVNARLRWSLAFTQQRKAGRNGSTSFCQITDFKISYLLLFL